MPKKEQNRPKFIQLHLNGKHCREMLVLLDCVSVCVLEKCQWVFMFQTVYVYIVCDFLFSCPCSSSIHSFSTLKPCCCCFWFCCAYLHSNSTGAHTLSVAIRSLSRFSRFKYKALTLLYWAWAWANLHRNSLTWEKSHSVWHYFKCFHRLHLHKSNLIRIQVVHAFKNKYVKR